MLYLIGQFVIRQNQHFHSRLIIIKVRASHSRAIEAGSRAPMPHIDAHESRTYLLEDKESSLLHNRQSKHASTALDADHDLEAPPHHEWDMRSQDDSDDESQSDEGE